MTKNFPQKLTRSTLRGIWAALIVPWKGDGFCEDTFRSEIDFYARNGLHGVYTGGTTGEFYAQDDATFAHLTKVACSAAKDAGIPIQIGATALSNRTAALRIRIALEHGADAVQLAIPFWLQLSDKEVLNFFAACVEAAGDTPIVIYNTLRCKRKVTPPLLGILAREFPTLIGTKDGCTVEELKAILADTPDLSVFSGEADLMPRMQAGGTGAYTAFAGMNPKLVVDLYEACAAGRWEEAKPLHELMVKALAAVRPLIDAGLQDSALDRLFRRLGGGRNSIVCQGPYASATEDDLERLRAWFSANAPEWLSF